MLLQNRIGTWHTARNLASRARRVEKPLCSRISFFSRLTTKTIVTARNLLPPGARVCTPKFKVWIVLNLNCFSSFQEGISFNLRQPSASGSSKLFIEDHGNTQFKLPSPFTTRHGNRGIKITGSQRGLEFFVVLTFVSCWPTPTLCTKSLLN